MCQGDHPKHLLQGAIKALTKPIGLWVVWGAVQGLNPTQLFGKFVRELCSSIRQDFSWKTHSGECLKQGTSHGLSMNISQSNSLWLLGGIAYYGQNILLARRTWHN